MRNADIAIGRLIVVGGHSRHVGKSTTVARLLRSFAPAPWTTVKISSHRHSGASVVIEGHSHLLRASDSGMGAAAEYIARLRAAGHNVIVESNRIVAHCRPDLVLFVVAPAIRDWKPSSGLCLQRADALVMLADGAMPAEALALGGERVRGLPFLRL